MIADIVSIILYAFLGLTVLIGALVGLKRGLYRSGVKLLANIASVAMALWITSVASDVLITDTFLTIWRSNSINFDTDATVFAEIIGAVAALIVFALVFLIVRLLMLIPQHIICKRLPRRYEEAVRVENESDGTVAPAYKDPKSGVYPWLKAGWSVFASLIGGVGAVVVVGVYVFPLVCFAVHTAEPVEAILDAIPETITIEDQTYELDKELSEGYGKIARHPSFLAVDALYGKTVYRPLLNVTLKNGVGNLDDSICTILNVASDVLPSAIDVVEAKTLSTEHISVIKDAANDISEDKVVVSLAVFGMNIHADSVDEFMEENIAEDSQLTRCEAELITAIEDIFKEATVQTVESDIDAAAEMLESLEGSNIFSILANDDGVSLSEISGDSLFDEDSLGHIFGVAYDSAGVSKLIIPMVNLCFEGVFSKADVEPVYTSKTLDEITREEFVEEGKRLSIAFRSFAKFLESTEAENTDISSCDLSAIGKALDCLRNSVLFGDKYNVLVDSFSAIIKNETEDEKIDEIIDIVGDAVTESDSAEKVLGSTQDILVFADELQKGEKKGSENEKIVSALDNLKNLESENDRNAVNTITEEVLGTVVTADNDTKKQIMADSVGAITEVLEEGTYDSKTEADAIQKLYDVANSKEKDEVSGNEKEITESVLNSQIAETLINNLNEKEENYGIDDGLSEENKKNFLDAINGSDADAEKKEALKKFLGLN